MALTILNGPWRFQPQGFKRRRPLTYKSTVKLVSGGAAIHLAGQGAQMNEARAEGGKSPLGSSTQTKGTPSCCATVTARSNCVSTGTPSWLSSIGAGPLEPTGSPACRQLAKITPGLLGLR
jgi:hypothetical protein